MANARSKCAFKWIKKFGLWDCTDGELHGSGKTKGAAYEDYRDACADDLFDSTIGWAGDSPVSSFVISGAKR